MQVCASVGLSEAPMSDAQIRGQRPCQIQEGSWTNEIFSDPSFGLWTHVAQFDTVSKDFFLWGGGCSEFALPCTGSWCDSNGLNVRLFAYNPVHLSWRALEHPSESAPIGRKRSALELAPGGNHGKSYEPSWMLYAYVYLVDGHGMTSTMPMISG